MLVAGLDGGHTLISSIPLGCTTVYLCEPFFFFYVEGFAITYQLKAELMTEYK